jgi:fructose/tagatose bisphosphate aldolase
VVPVRRVEEGAGSADLNDLLPVQKELDFIRDTGIYCYAPAIGTAHGFYKEAPVILYDRLQYLVEAAKMPMVVHGGTGLTDEVFKRLISLGAAKLNISTALKKTFADGFVNYVEAHPTEYDPLKLIGAVRSDVVKMALSVFKLFGSEGRV